jgi:hypothetical protein
MSVRRSVAVLSSAVVSSALMASLMLFSTSAPAQTKHSHSDQHQHDHDHDHDHDGMQTQGKHVHGIVTLNLALEGGLLSAQLETPALHVLGFENAPNTPEQKSASTAADSWLQSGKNILAVPRNAGCRLERVDYKAPKLGPGHADYRARFDFRCSNPAALGWTDFSALDKLKDVEKVEVNLITASAQRQITLQGGARRITLQ